VLVASDVSEARRNDRRRIVSYWLSALVREAETPEKLLRGVEDALRRAIHAEAFHFAVLDARSGRTSIPHFYDRRMAEPAADEATDGLTAYGMRADAAVVLTSSQIQSLVAKGEATTPSMRPSHWASAPVIVDETLRGVL